MDARKYRIAEHAAAHPPAWLAPRSARSPPIRGPGRLVWRNGPHPSRWRELSVYDHPADLSPRTGCVRPLRARPPVTRPLAASARRGPTCAAIRRQASAPARHLPGRYRWAPQYVADELRQSSPQLGARWSACGRRRGSRRRAAAATTNTPRPASSGRRFTRPWSMPYRSAKTVCALHGRRADWENRHPRPAPAGGRAGPGCRAARRATRPVLLPAALAEPCPATGASARLPPTPDSAAVEIDRGSPLAVGTAPSLTVCLTGRAGGSRRGPDYGYLGPRSAWTSRRRIRSCSRLSQGGGGGGWGGWEYPAVPQTSKR